MAVDLHNRDALLPPDVYFTEEDNMLSVDKQNFSPWFGSSDSGSVLSSPIESEFGSTESESEQDEDYIAELNRQMAYDMLQDDDHDHGKYDKTQGSAGWPEPEIRSQLGLSGREEVAMIDKFGKLMINDEDIHNSVPLTMKTPIDDFQSKQALIDYQIKAIQFYKLKREQIMQQQESLCWGNQPTWHKQNEPRTKQKFRQFQTWTNLQQQQHRTGSDMRAVIHGEPGSRRSVSGGTGVFLPRGRITTNNSVSRNKKPGCPTVFMPARVVQALKQHFDKMGVEARSNNGGIFLPQNDALTGDVTYRMQLQQKSHSKAVPAMTYHQGTCLPQEWTY